MKYSFLKIITLSCLCLLQLFCCKAQAQQTTGWDWAVRMGGAYGNLNLINIPADLATDTDGNVYLTGKGVTVFDSKGNQIGHIPVDATWTANACFGGGDRKTLFITASDAVYSLQMKVRGVW